MLNKVLGALLLALFFADTLAGHVGLGRHSRRRVFNDKAIKAHVFTGYMDEEVTYTLQNVLKAQAQQYAGVIVIERNNPVKTDAAPSTPVPKGSDATVQKKAAGWLLQRPVCKYDANAAVHVLVPIKDDTVVDNKDTLGAVWKYGEPQQVCGNVALDDKSAGVLANFKKAYQDLFNTKETRQALYDVWSEKGSFDGQGKPKMSVKGFDKDTAVAPLIYIFGAIDFSSTMPLAIVIRAFEMGLNPGAVTPALTLAVQGLKAANVAEFSFFAIGAGGAANALDCAGSYSFLQASWYAGVAMTGHSTPTMTLQYDQAASKTAAGTDVKISDVGGDVKPASLKAAWEARTPGADGKLNAAKYPAKQQALEQDIVTAFKKSHPDARIGMTYTYFGGWNSKLASNTVHGHSANMEDYHVIKAVNEFAANRNGLYPALQYEGVWRVDADPYCIKDTHKTALDTWMNTEATISFGTLVKIWQWNFQGLPLDQLAAANGCWSMVTAGDAAFKKAFIPIGNSDCVPNPFFVELAVDFWADGPVVDTVFAAVGGDTATDGTISSLIAATFNSIGDARVLAIKKLAFVYCQRAWAIEKKALNVPKPVSTTLHTKIADADAFGAAFNKDALPADGKICPLWARDGWAIPTYFTTQQLDAMKAPFSDPKPAKFVYFAHWFKGMAADGVDRLFYKASNFPGIEKLNKKLFSGGKSPIDFLSQAKTMANEPVCDVALSTGCPVPN